MSYAEAAVLLDQTDARVADGARQPGPVPAARRGRQPGRERSTSIRLLRRLIDGHRRFVYVASEPGDRGVPDRRPGAAAAGVRRPRHAGRADRGVRRGHRVRRHADRRRHAGTASRCGRRSGCCGSGTRWRRRCWSGCTGRRRWPRRRCSTPTATTSRWPPRIALADSVLLPDRGFPLLIDLADRTCKSVYGGGSLTEMANAAYARVGAAAPLPERAGRTGPDGWSTSL